MMDANVIALHNHEVKEFKQYKREQKAYAEAIEDCKFLDFFDIIEALDSSEVTEMKRKDFEKAWQSQDARLIGIVAMEIINGYWFKVKLDERLS